jgi:hypothetical protein
VLIETTPIVACCDFAELPKTDTKPLTEIQPLAIVQVDVVLPANDPAEAMRTPISPVRWLTEYASTP